MTQVIEITRSSRLLAPAAQVWARAVTWEGVNAELWPIRMTAPAEWRGREIDSVPCGQPLFDSWILLFGVLPTDIHHFRLESLGPGFRFQENSSSLVNRQWRHQRIVEPDNGGCILTDRLEIVPRLALFGLLMAPVYRLVFWNRHRNCAAGTAHGRINERGLRHRRLGLRRPQPDPAPEGARRHGARAGAL